VSKPIEPALAAGEARCLDCGGDRRGRCKGPRERASGKVISLMDALRRSIEGDTTRRPASKSTADARRKTASDAQ
jgi:non-homologous end joining protein Ku